MDKSKEAVEIFDRLADVYISIVRNEKDTKRPVLQTVSDLKQDLELFTTLLRQEGFEPKS